MNLRHAQPAGIVFRWRGTPSNAEKYNKHIGCPPIDVWLTHPLSDQLSPTGSGPIEVIFVTCANPPMAWVGTMFVGKLWRA